jgi:hypothetical protein
MWTYWTIGTLSALIIGVATSWWEVFLFPIIFPAAVARQRHLGVDEAK